MKACVSVAMKAHLASGTTTLATCWRATLRDGTVIAATSHDRNITYDSVEYLSSAAFRRSDVASGSDLNPDNLEIDGFLTAPAITDEDIYSGRWDYAEILIFKVNYNDLTMGTIPVRSGTLGEVRAGRASFNAELRGLMQAYSRRIVRLTTKECPWDLGQVDVFGGVSPCGIDLTSWTVTGTVLSVASNREITDPTRTEAADWFTGAKLTFTSGLNNGLSMEVKDSSLAVIKLHLPMPFTIAAGDTYSVHAGCTKRFEEDCKGKFNNAVNYGGFHLLPGQRIYRRGGT